MDGTLYIGIGDRYRLCEMSMSNYSVKETEKYFYAEDKTAYNGSTQGIYVDQDSIWWFGNIAGKTQNFIIRYNR